MTLPAILEQAIKNAYIEMLKDKHHSLILKKADLFMMQ